DGGACRVQGGAVGHGAAPARSGAGAGRGGGPGDPGASANPDAGAAAEHTGRKGIMMALLLRPIPALLLAVICIGGWITSGSAAGIDVQSVRSPGGIEAWLVEDHNVPVVAVTLAFKGGAAADPEG